MHWLARRRRREAGKTSPTSGRRRRDVGRARSGCCRRASRGGFRPAQDAIVDEQESRGGRAVENTLGKASGDELEEVAFAAATPASTCRGRTPPPSTRWGRLLLPSTRRGGEAVLGAQGRLPAPSSLRRWSTRRRLPRAGRLLTISRWRDIDNLYKTLKKNIKEIDKDAKFYDNMSSKMDKPLAEECWSEIEAWEHGCRQCTG